MEPDKVKEELDSLWDKYISIIKKDEPSWDEINEARAILYLTSFLYCEKIAVEAIERRLHLLKNKMSLIEFFNVIDKNSEKLIELRKDGLFAKLEHYYRVIKNYKNRRIEGKYYHEEERFLKKYEQANPDKDLKLGYMGSFKLE
ncbi:MAG: hypothetical protein V1645_05090 [archaeon]